MSKSEQISHMTNVMAKFVGIPAKSYLMTSLQNWKICIRKRPVNWLTLSLRP